MSAASAILECQSADHGGYDILVGLLTIAQAAEARALASALLEEFGTLSKALSAGVPAQTRVIGDRPEVVRCLALVRQAMLHALVTEVASAPVLNNTEAVLSYLHVAMAHQPREQMRVLFLDNWLRLICDEVVSEGTVTSTPCEPREILRRALEVGAVGLILAHNHPSGNPTPSRDDIQITRRVKEAACTLGIVLHDHIVVSRTGHTSLREQGLT
jgi:DNA repair protein RadC